MHRLMALGFALAVFASAGAELPQAPPPREAVDVAALVRQLGSADFAEREGATARLSVLDVGEVPPELLAALKSVDPEVRERAARAVRALREYIARAPERAALAKLPRHERFAARGQIDLYVAATAALDVKADDERLWAPALKLGAKLIALDDEVPGFPELKGVNPRGGPAMSKDFAEYRRTANPEVLRTDLLYTRPRDKYEYGLAAIQAAGVKAEKMLRGLIVSHGPVAVDGSIRDALILANGDVTVKGIVNSVVICDGDIDAGAVSMSIVIARGKIDGRFNPDVSTVIAGGTVKTWPANAGRPSPPEPIPAGLRAQDVKSYLFHQARKRKQLGEVRENDRRPFGFVTFFELSAVGLDVKVTDGQVTVSAVADGKPFAKGGVEIGDAVTAVNGKKPDTAESLRRLLRDALALGDAAVTLRRGDKDLTVKVSLPE